MSSTYCGVLSSLAVKCSLLPCGPFAQRSSAVFCAECVFVDYAGSGTLTARFSAVQYVGALFQRAPKAITKVAGTAMTASVFS